MWTCLGNLFLHNRNTLIQQRNFNNDVPSLNSILGICRKGKIVFADIVKGIRPNITAIPNPINQTVLVNNEFIWSGYKDQPLDHMANKGWLDDNVAEIIKFINGCKTIKHIYFTFKSCKWVAAKKQQLTNGVRNDVDACSIFTPTGNGFGSQLSAPFNERAWGLTHCWVWNGLNHQAPIHRPGYGHLSHYWLAANGVNPNNF